MNMAYTEIHLYTARSFSLQCARRLHRSSEEQCCENVFRFDVCGFHPSINTRTGTVNYAEFAKAMRSVMGTDISPTSATVTAEEKEEKEEKEGKRAEGEPVLPVLTDGIRL